jgi:hypothetical protein
MNKNGSSNDAVAAGEEPWFDEVRAVDNEWAELSVTTSKGVVVYRVPRRTLFRQIDGTNISSLG